MDPAQEHRTQFPIHLITSSTNTTFTHFLHSLRHSTLISLDAEWKPRQSSQSSSSSFPPVTLLQIACKIESPPSIEVFLVDLLGVEFGEVYAPIKELFEDERVIKLGFCFKQDLVFLSKTFASNGFEPGFDKVEPFLDITNIYHHLKNQNFDNKPSKCTKSLASICDELLGISLSKELQCSDWSSRPLTQDQIQYAANDAYYLLEIFSIFQQKINSELNKDHDELLQLIIENYGDKIELKDSDKVPRLTKKKGKERNGKGKLDVNIEWIGPAPWDVLIGGDGNPKFLCDVMIEGLAKSLRCVGIDAATPSSKKPDPRELLSQAYKEKRVILTRDVKLFRYQYLSENQVYRVKNLIKNDQLLEVIETFQLSISEDRLMSRCTKCNGNFIQKPLSIEEAIEASRGFQKIPSCLFKENLEFWKCTDCNQLYWEGTQYHNAVEKFISICKLKE